MRVDPFAAFALPSFLLLFYVVVIRLHFAVPPLIFLALGFVSFLWSGRRAMWLFMFLLPLIGAVPGLFFNGYPFNYMGVPLFYLAGMAFAAGPGKVAPAIDFPGRRSYLLFLSLLCISAIFVFLRWSNLGLASLAFLRDTPVAPSQDRVSFAIIFPAITLALFSLSPFLFFLLRRLGMKEREIFNPLRAGFCLSLAIAMIQKWIAPGFMAQGWWGERMKQLNGGFSDFNAFGFFAGAMFLWQALRLIERLPGRENGGNGKGPGPLPRRLPGADRLAADLLFLAAALAAVFISGCRTAFLFVLAALLRLLLSRRLRGRAKAAGAVLLALALLFGGGTLARRLRRSTEILTRVSSAAELYRAADTISNGRMAMLRDGGRMIGRFPLSGVGSGNFLFCLKQLRFGSEGFLDLPLNQYLLFFSEGGIICGLAFLFFLAALLRRLKPGQERFIMVAMALALFFNNFFWFPEVLLLFWVVVSRGEWQPGPERKSGFARAAALLLLFTVANGIAFDRLHPRTWARETSTPFDYGFSYPERDGSRSFRWSGAASGMYLFPAKNRPAPEVLLTCGAPLSHLPGRRQAVDVYWRGKLLKRVIFRENATVPIRIEDKEDPEGFLEFRVHPTFNLSRLGLGPETRELGVQVEGGV